MATVTYSRITFVTQAPPSNYIDQLIPITILVGTNHAVCSIGSCSFTWARSVTPYLLSVSPTSINGPQSIILTGQNLAATGSIMGANTHVTIDGQSCNVTAVSNSTITCTIGNIQVGNHTVVASIDGMIVPKYLQKRYAHFIFFCISRCWQCRIITNSYIYGNYFLYLTHIR